MLDIFKLDSADQREEYEKKLYTSFIQAGLEEVFSIWEVTEAGRAKHGIPYEHLSIYVCSLNGEITSGLAVNTTYNCYQLEKFGFEVEKNEGTCEVLSLFSLHNSSRSYGQKMFFYALEALFSQGYSKIYTTASGIRARVYERMAGFTKLDCKDVEGVSKYLLELDIERKLSQIGV